MDIVVRTPNWIGDCIMSLPALRALKEGCPEKNIILISKRHISEVFNNLEVVKEIISIPNKTGIRNLFRTAAGLKKYKAAPCILFTNSFYSALLFRLAGFKKLIGYNKDARGFLLDKKLKFPGKENIKHHVFFYIEIIEAFMEKKLKKKYSDASVITTAEKADAGKLLSTKFGIDLSKILIGVSPSAAYGTAKQWPPQRFAELLQRIIGENEGCEILLFGTGKEQEKAEKIANLAGNHHIYNLAGDLTLRQAITTISLCNLFISNDSGLMHVASSLRIPLVAIFGPTLPHKTAPLFEEAAVLYHPVDCAPCKHRDCPTDHRCINAITVDEVYEEVKNRI